MRNSPRLAASAQQTLYSAERTLVQTELVELTNAVSLYRALGGGLT